MLSYRVASTVRRSRPLALARRRVSQRQRPLSHEPGLLPGQSTIAAPESKRAPLGALLAVPVSLAMWGVIAAVLI